MPRPEDHQSNLIAALIDATAAHDAPPFMTPDKEAIALLQLMRTVEELLRDGYCPLVKLMALGQQAIRCGAMGCVQGDQGEDVADSLIARTVSRAN
jgi:hypothetical protein